MTDLIARVEVAELTATIEAPELTAQIGFTAPVLPDYFRWRQERFDPYFHLPLNDPPGSTIAKALAGPDGVHVRFNDYPPFTVYPTSAPEPAMRMEPLQAEEYPFPVCGAPSVIPGYPHYTSTRYAKSPGRGDRGADTYAGDNETFSFVNRTGIFTICWWGLYRGDRDWGPSTSRATPVNPGFTSEFRPNPGRVVANFKNLEINRSLGRTTRSALSQTSSTHFCLTGEDGSVRFFINGFQIDNSNWAFPFFDGPTHHPLLVCGQGRADGDIAGLLIDTRPWTPKEVQLDYLRGMGVWE